VVAIEAIVRELKDMGQSEDAPYFSLYYALIGEAIRLADRFQHNLAAGHFEECARIIETLRSFVRIATESGYERLNALLVLLIYRFVEAISQKGKRPVHDGIVDAVERGKGQPIFPQAELENGR